VKITKNDINILNSNYFLSLEQSIDEITKKYLFKNKFNKLTLAYNNALSTIPNNKYELLIVNTIYNLFKDEIELYYKIQKSEWHKSNHYIFKTLLAWKQNLRIRDTRNNYQLALNVRKGQAKEDNIYNILIKKGYEIEKVGKDANRELAFFTFNTFPDLKINNKLVEVQAGIKCFFKQQKIRKAIKNQSYILFYHPQINKYYLFNYQEIEEINETKTVYEFDGKKEGKIFDYKTYYFDDLEVVLKELYE